MTSGPVQLSISVDRRERPVTGRVSALAQPDRGFCGWGELFGAIRAALIAEGAAETVEPGVVSEPLVAERDPTKDVGGLG
jgi:hypothetical protein